MRKPKIPIQQIYAFLSTLTDEEIQLIKNAKTGGTNTKCWHLHTRFKLKVFNSIPDANTGTLVKAWNILRNS